MLATNVRDVTMFVIMESMMVMQCMSGATTLKNGPKLRAWTQVELL